MIALLLILMPLARAEDATLWSSDLSGHAKSFFLASFPYESVLLPEDPFGSGILSLRANYGAGAKRGDWGARLQAHVAVEERVPGSSTSAFSLGTSSVQELPQAVDLSWSSQGEGLAQSLRVDRLALLLDAPHLRLSAGRQAISFGRSLLFTPLDLVMPFHPAVIDQEYKPGVDALRLDAFAGTSSQLSLVAAQAGSWDRQGMVWAGQAQSTVGLWDLGLLTGSVHGDLVGGLSASGSLGPVGIWAEGSATLPYDDAEPFLRTVLGGSARPSEKSFVTGEFYFQSLGASDPADYLAQGQDPRYTRGELWALGRLYAGLSGTWELDPLLNLRAFALVNLQDPSALIGPGLGWSIAENARLDMGGYLGLGERPGEIDPEALARAAATGLGSLESLVPVRSEFGLVPSTFFLSLAASF